MVIGGTAAPNSGAKYQECTCIGIEYRGIRKGGDYITCYGIPTSYRCYENMWSEEKGEYKKYVPCK